MSFRRETSSPETVTSCASALGYDMAEDRSFASLSRSNSDRNFASQGLTGGENVVRTYTKSPNYLPLACLALLMNPVLGIPAYACSLNSRRLRREGNDRASAKFSKYAFWLSLVAIASSVVIIIFIIVYVMVITPNIIRSIKGLPDTGEARLQQSAEGVEIFSTMKTTSVHSH